MLGELLLLHRKSQFGTGFLVQLAPKREAQTQTRLQGSFGLLFEPSALLLPAGHTGFCDFV